MSKLQNHRNKAHKKRFRCAMEQIYNNNSKWSTTSIPAPRSGFYSASGNRDYSTCAHRPL